ncbi:hypothetical protein HPB52_025439 [Rhipicephalus sanguineus]|uniref:CCHC-type domain-containing protein n=1 Tax=Rhipicephalus sanguineus TaxID=34632 RepID=A0A9D4YRC4_RHISA|nr:hypothetical protein HPB52_025439 [Rhipicephalus sanguineus]
MAYAVEGNDLDPSEFNDGSWTLALDMQKKYRRRTGTVSSPINGETTLTSESVPTPRRQARPPPTVRRRPMPRLPEDDYKVVLRPNGAINLTDVGPAIIVEAICIAASIDFRLALKEDQVRIHPIKNTITVSTPDRLRAEAYRKITQLQHERNALSIPVAAYVPAPDNSVKGVIYKAHSYEDDQGIYEEVSGRNPDLPVVSARRLGQTNHCVITFAGDKLPKYVRFLALTFEVFPFRERLEACFNCRKLGHRTDVCPKPRPQVPRCRRCGEEHTPPPEGEKPTCPPSCVVCGGGHQTGSRNCKYRFITKKQPGKPVAADNAKGQEIDKPAPDSIPSQQGTTTKNKTAATWESRSKENNGGESRSHSESFPPLRGRSESRDRSESRPRRDHSSESRGERSTSRPRGNRSTSRPRGDRSSSSHKQATSKGNKPAPPPRPKSPQDS